MQVLAEQSDATAAFAALDPVVDSPQRSATVLTALGDMAVQAYDFKRAEHLVEEALQRDPKNPEDVDVKAPEDHWYDALRYGIMLIDRTPSPGRAPTPAPPDSNCRSWSRGRGMIP